MTPYSADTGTTLWYHTGSYDINFKYSFSKKWWSHLRRSCSRLQDFSCRRDHDADADAIMKFFTWSKTEKLREWPHDRTQFPADGIRTFRLLYIRSLVHDVIKIEVHDRVCVCAPSAENIDTHYYHYENFFTSPLYIENLVSQAYLRDDIIIFVP